LPPHPPPQRSGSLLPPPRSHESALRTPSAPPHQPQTLDHPRLPAPETLGSRPPPHGGIQRQVTPFPFTPRLPPISRPQACTCVPLRTHALPAPACQTRPAGPGGPIPPWPCTTPNRESQHQWASTAKAPCCPALCSAATMRRWRVSSVLPPFAARPESKR